MKNLYLSLFLLSLSAQGICATQKWELNDVSYLMDLPKAQDGEDFLLRAFDEGKKGPLLPEKATTEEFKDLLIGYDRPEPDNPYRSLSVVGMRIDPCFKFTTTTVEKCHPQMRLVLQPTAGLGTKKARTFDAAVHTFYDLTDKEFKGLTQRLQALKSKNLLEGVTTKFAPLNVHPAYLNPKTRATFNDELNSIILTYAGSKNIVRFTAMKLMSTDLWWSFRGQDKNKAGVWEPTVIPRMKAGSLNQDFFNEDRVNDMGIKGSIVPILQASKDNLAAMVKGFGVSQDEEGLQVVKKGYLTINRIENPTLESPASMDCVSCHIAEPGKRFIQWKFPEMAKAATTEQLKFKTAGTHNLKNTTWLSHLKSIRAFGYFNEKPSLNQRMINETAEVADKLNSLRN